MEKKHKLLNLYISTCEKLEKEPNQSDTVERALKLYFDSKDSARKVVALADRLEAHLDKQTLKQSPVAEQLEGLGLKYDPTLRGKAWNPENEQYVPYQVVNGEVVL